MTVDYMEQMTTRTTARWYALALYGATCRSHIDRESQFQRHKTERLFF
jgi:hypothetical protein